MTTFRQRLFTALPLATLLAAPALLSAQDAEQPLRIDFQTLDSNNDGYITRDELPADHPLILQFNDLDSNGDGRLSPEDLEDLD